MNAKLLDSPEMDAATIKLLAINHSDRLLERKILIGAGRHPSSAALVLIQSP